MERSRRNITKGCNMIYQGGKPKNKPFDKREMARFIASAESFSDKPYKDANGYWTIGYGHKLSDDKSIERWQGDYADGITKQEAIQLLEQDMDRNWDYLETEMKKKGVNIDTLPGDIKAAFMMYSYGGTATPIKSGAIDMLVEAQKQGFSDTSRRMISERVYRESEGKLGGIQTRMALYRAMIEGKYDYDFDRNNFGRENWNIYSNAEKYKAYRYDNYNYTYKKVVGEDRKIYEYNPYKYNPDLDQGIQGSVDKRTYINKPDRDKLIFKSLSW